MATIPSLFRRAENHHQIFFSTRSLLVLFMEKNSRTLFSMAYDFTGAVHSSDHFLTVRINTFVLPVCSSESFILLISALGSTISQLPPFSEFGMVNVPFSFRRSR